MTIRRADHRDVDALVAMALRFQESTNYAAHLRATAESFRRLIETILDNDTAAIWVAAREDRPVGMMAATLYLQPMSGECIGAELCWWMEPEARGGRTALRLIRTAEHWARSGGAVLFQLTAPTPAVGQFYEALQYQPVETQYLRRIA
jgi:GNAT superfamily N-acetyltransferase